MAVTPKRMSLAEFLELPEVKPALELRHGMVSQKMPPSGPHVAIQVWFGYQVDMFAEPQELARAFPEVRLILGNDTYVTDVAVYRWDRIPVDEHGDLPMHFRTSPDLAVEVISPGQTVRDQMDKCREYLGHGVRVAVVADPIRRNVFVLRANGEVGPLQEGDDIDITDVLPGFQMRVSDLFSRIRARPPETRTVERRGSGTDLAWRRSGYNGVTMRFGGEIASSRRHNAFDRCLGADRTLTAGRSVLSRSRNARGTGA